MEGIALATMRPGIRLGSLYDRRTDNVLPGLTFLKEESFNKKGFISETPSSNKKWLIDSENTFSSKFMKLDIEAGLALSLLGELVDIKGHAKYFEDTDSSTNVVKVSLTYKETTVYKELTSEALKNLEYRDPLTNNEQKDEFTHVVVGIQYGGICTMVFEREIKESEIKEEIAGALSDVLESIPISGEGTLKLNSEEKEKVGNFKCTVFSDFKSNASVVNWYEAFSFYKSLPIKISASGGTDAKIGLPVKILLLPKHLLGYQHNTLVKELSSKVQNKPREIIESLTAAINELHDLLVKTKTCPILASKIDRFTKLVENYRATFRKDILSVLLVSIRSGTNDEKLLSDAFEKHEHSAFGYLNPWIRRTRLEIDTLLETQNQLSEEYISYANTLFEESILKKTTNVVFTMKVCKRDDKFIDEMESYYNNLAQNETKISEIVIPEILNIKKWFEDESLKEKMRGMAHQMKVFASANQINEDVGFFLRETECEETPYFCIDVWEKGKKLNFMSFEPPSEIRNLQIKEYSYNTIEIKWNVPEDGRSSISNYKIQTIDITVADKKKSLESFDQIKIPPAAGETMTHIVTNLQPGREYEISVQCLCLNDHAFSKAVILRQMTRLSNPPVNFKGELTEKRHVKLAWEPPTIKAECANLKGFMIEYKPTNGKSLFSKFEPPDVRSSTLCNLSYGTEYQFKILACYNNEKETLPSEGIKLETKPMEVPQNIEVKKYFHSISFKKFEEIKFVLLNKV